MLVQIPLERLSWAFMSEDKATYEDGEALYLISCSLPCKY
jgi:hypothetical protein